MIVPVADPQEIRYSRSGVFMRVVAGAALHSHSRGGSPIPVVRLFQQHKRPGRRPADLERYQIVLTLLRFCIDQVRIEFYRDRMVSAYVSPDIACTLRHYPPSARTLHAQRTERRAGIDH